MAALLGIIFMLVGICYLLITGAAVAEGVEIWWGWSGWIGAVIFFPSLFFFPGIALFVWSIVAFYGAYYGWHWSFWAAGLFLVPVLVGPVFIVLFGLASLADLVTALLRRIKG